MKKEKDKLRKRKKRAEEKKVAEEAKKQQEQAHQAEEETKRRRVALRRLAERMALDEAFGSSSESDSESKWARCLFTLQFDAAHNPQ